MDDREFVATYEGFASFFKAPMIDVEQIREGMAVVAGVPIDQGINMGRAGAKWGPRGIREASLHYRALQQAAAEQTVVDVDSHVALRLKEKPNIGDIGDFTIYPTDLMKTTEAVKKGVSEVVQRGGFPVVLGGDHYVAYPSFEGFALGMAERKPNPRLGYLHIDSHTDFWDDWGTGGKYNHGTCVRRISENPMVSYKNLAWMGLNGSTLDADQYRLLRSHSLKMLSSRTLLERGVEETVKEAIETAADGTDAVYVSVDIDVVDGSQSPGTTAAVFGGITVLDFLSLMETLSKYPIIKAIDLCEVSPPLDPTGRTVRIAASGLLAVLGPRLFDVVDLG